MISILSLLWFWFLVNQKESQNICDSLWKWLFPLSFSCWELDEKIDSLFHRYETSSALFSQKLVYISKVTFLIHILYFFYAQKQHNETEWYNVSLWPSWQKPYLPSFPLFKQAQTCVCSLFIQLSPKKLKTIPISVISIKTKGIWCKSHL